MFYYNRKKKEIKKPRKKITYKGQVMASKAEVNFAMWMDEMKIEWMYEPEKWDWVPPKRKYTPDFKVMRKDGTYFFVEYKGWLRPEDRTKMKAIKQQYPYIDIRFIFTNASKPIYKGSKTTYAGWAEQHGFFWAEKIMPEEWLEEA